MKRRLAEETILFISVVKWIVLATMAGIVVGLATTVFLKLLAWSIGFSGRFPDYYLSLPLVLFLSALMIRYLAPEAAGHGTEKVIEAVHERSGKIDPMVVPVKLLATILTLAGGGSVGKEGPCAQIGAGITSFISDLFRFDDMDRKKLVICGISAGFASVFGTPIAGSIFGVEVLFVGNLLYDVLLPSFIAGITSYHISSSLGITYFNHPIQFIPNFYGPFFLQVILGGIVFGLCSFLLIEMMKGTEKLSNKLPLWPPLKGILGGCVLVLLTRLFSKEFLGLGLDTIQSALSGTAVTRGSFLLKMVFTSVTLAFGGSGGIVTPIFFIGASAGSLFAAVLKLDPATFAAIGLVSLLAGSANTPIAASIMSVELFGPKIAPYATVACVISYLMTGHRSVYPSQVLAVSKSPSIIVETSRPIENVVTTIRPRRRSLADLLLKGVKALKAAWFGKSA
jgi:H+/Cl- antiporter ClcA